MSQYFKKSLPTYGNLITAVLLVILAVLGPITKGFAAHSFAPVALIFLILAAICSLASFFVEQSYLPLLATILVAISFGVIVYFSLPIFADKVNDLNFQEGDFGATLTYTILSGIATITSIVPCFDSKR